MNLVVISLLEVLLMQIWSNHKNKISILLVLMILNREQNRLWLFLSFSIPIDVYAAATNYTFIIMSRNLLF